MIGLAKNTGKTTALNAVISQLAGNGRRLGITSIGRDGEQTDLVTSTHKPRVYVPENTLVATAEQLYDLSEVGMDILMSTDHQTPMGPVLIANTLEAGNVQIGGASTNLGLRETAEICLDLGADQVLVDGALGRASLASPVVAEGCIVCTGAALSPDMEKTAIETAHVVRVFGQQAAAPEYIKALQTNMVQTNALQTNVLQTNALQTNALQTNSVQTSKMDDNQSIWYILKNGSPAKSSLKTALGAGSKIRGEVKNLGVAAVYLPGAITYGLLNEYYNAAGPAVDWIVDDPTKIFIGPSQYNMLMHRSVNISVLKKIKILCICANPVSPAGLNYDPVEFLKLLRSKIIGIDIIDIFLEEGRC